MDESFVFQTLPERLAEMFPEIDSDTVNDLLHTNGEYQKLHMRKKEFIAQNPFISAVLEGDGPVSLTADEHESLAKYLNMVAQMENMERMQIYFRGHTDCFSYLKKIGKL